MMSYQIRDTEETVWSVLTSFGFSESERAESKNSFSLDKKEAVIVTGGNPRETAQACAAVFESAFACGMQEFYADIKDEEVYSLLILFGFENIIRLKKNIKNSFSVYYGDTEFSSGAVSGDRTVTKTDIKAVFDICGDNEEFSKEISESLVFAEKGADGIAYDICYNLRVNGCIVEMYCGDYSIDNAESYAKEKGHAAVIRCMKDGCLEIKDMIKNEITETTVKDFLGYYEDECDCEDGHCDCGHHHH